MPYLGDNYTFMSIGESQQEARFNAELQKWSAVNHEFWERQFIVKTLRSPGKRRG